MEIFVTLDKTKMSTENIRGLNLGTVSLTAVIVRKLSLYVV
jgi:hypothetical protein